MTPDELREIIKTAEAADVELRRLSRVIESGRGTYATVTKYSERVGHILSRNFSNALTGVEMISEEDAMALFAPRMRDAYRLIARESGIVQKSLNEKAGMSINGLVPDVNESRISHWCQKLASGELEDTDFLTGDDAMQNFARSAVTDTIEYNAEFQSEAGLESYIERDAGGGCCEWCESMAGRYVYGEQPDDFFRVHKDCTCSITFMPVKQRWTRTTFRTDDEGNRHRYITTIG